MEHLPEEKPQKAGSDRGAHAVNPRMGPGQKAGGQGGRRVFSICGKGKARNMGRRRAGSGQTGPPVWKEGCPCFISIIIPMAKGLTRKLK